MKKFILSSFTCIILIFIFMMLSPTPSYAATDETVKDAQTSLKKEDNGCVVLNYHLIKDSGPLLSIYHKLYGYSYSPQYNVSTKEFAEQMKFLHDNDIPVYSSEELEKAMSNNSVPDKCVTLTFDDIDQSVYNNAFPILKKYNYPFTLFIITNKLPPNSGLKQENLTNIKKMKASNLASIGLHTDSMHNPDPETGQPPFLDSRNLKAFKKDTKTSIAKYEEAFGEKPRYFAYPHGFGIPQTDRILNNAGIKQLFTLSGGVVNNDTSNDFIPRILITNENFNIVEDWLTD